MNSRRESLLQGDASPPGGPPYALYDAGEKGRARPLPVVSGHRETEAGRRLAWAAGLAIFLGFAAFCLWLLSLLVGQLQGAPTPLEDLPRRARAAVYLSPLLLLCLPAILRIYLLPLFVAHDQDVVLRLDARGFLDRRNGHGFLPWSAVRALKGRLGFVELKVDWKALPQEQRPGGLFGRFKRLRVLTLPLEVSGRELLREMQVRRRAAPRSQSSQ